MKKEADGIKKNGKVANDYLAETTKIKTSIFLLFMTVNNTNFKLRMSSCIIS